MVKFPDLVDVEYKGHLGKRAIHLAATLDNWECAEALLKAGSKLCESCDNGFLPLHLAAKSASCKTISIMVQKGIVQTNSPLKWLVVKISSFRRRGRLFERRPYGMD